MKSTKSFAAAMFAASLLLGASQASADTFYRLGDAQGLALVIDPASISEASDGHRTATVYFVETWQVAEQRKVEIDCANRKQLTRARTLVRTDGAPLHARVLKGWETTNPQDMGGRVDAFVCAQPSIPASARAQSANSLADYLRTTSDELRANRSNSLPLTVTGLSPVGNCILAALPKDVARDAVTNLATGKNPSGDPRLRQGVKVAGAKCTGRAESDSDELTVSATLAVFGRLASFGNLKRRGPLTEDRLLAAWNAASASIRKPFQELAGLMGTSATAQDVLASDRTLAQQAVKQLLATADIASILAQDRDLSDAARLALGYEYYAAVALGEFAEGALNPPPPA